MRLARIGRWAVYRVLFLGRVQCHVNGLLWIVNVELLAKRLVVFGDYLDPDRALRNSREAGNAFHIRADFPVDRLTPSQFEYLAMRAQKIENHRRPLNGRILLILHLHLNCRRRMLCQERSCADQKESQNCPRLHSRIIAQSTPGDRPLTIAFQSRSAVPLQSSRRDGIAAQSRACRSGRWSAWCLLHRYRSSFHLPGQTSAESGRRIYRKPFVCTAARLPDWLPRRRRQTRKASSVQ